MESNFKTQNPITIKVMVKGTPQKVWQYFNEPEHIKQWAFADDSWECTSSENDVREGGKFKNALSAKDKSYGFDFAGTYTNVKEPELLEFDLDDSRHVKVEFVSRDDEVEVIETFDPETENDVELQRSGWQAFLNNFKKHVEAS